MTDTINFACGCFVSFFVVDGELQSGLACCDTHERPHQTLAGIVGDKYEIAFTERYVPVHIPTIQESFDELKKKFPDAELVEGRTPMETGVSFTVSELLGRWNTPSVRVTFDVSPGGYPFSVPECFWAPETFRMANGARHFRSGIRPRNSQYAMWFWFKPHSWDPRVNTMLTYARMIVLALQGKFDREPVEQS